MAARDRLVVVVGVRVLASELPFDPMEFERVTLMAHTPSMDGDEQPDHPVEAYRCPEHDMAFLDAQKHLDVFH